MNCKKCKHDEMKITERIFRNGTKHLEQRCLKCNAHNGYKKQDMNPQKAGDVVFTFGKHKGKRICDVAKEDPEHLAWCFAEFDEKHYIRRALEVF